ncbi:MAG: transketolase [Solobacterium sp.]|nr:transketolase [Solobacterium sp.]
MDIEKLRQHARNIRINIIKQVSNANSGHPGGSLGAADIVTLLYFEVMDINKDNVGTINRDRFVLSKGHASPLLYATLAEKGFIPEEELMTFRKLNTRLQGHPDINSLEGVDMSTGSLGQGFSAAVGMSLANKLDKNDHRIYCLAGDGECEEGQIWEAAMAAHHYRCDNLCLIIDENGLQIDGRTSDVISPAPFEEKFRAFGWHVISVDGHDFEALKRAFDEAKTVKGVPTCIVAKTIKGKGVSFMENVADWHGKAPNAELTEVALRDLEAE